MGILSYGFLFRTERVLIPENTEVLRNVKG